MSDLIYFVMMRELILIDPNIHVWAFGLEVWKTNACRKFHIPSILRFWIGASLFTIFLGRFGWFRVVSAVFSSFWLVSACFGSFRVSVTTLNTKFSYLHSLKITSPTVKCSRWNMCVQLSRNTKTPRERYMEILREPSIWHYIKGVGNMATNNFWKLKFGIKNIMPFCVICSLTPQNIKETV